MAYQLNVLLRNFVQTSVVMRQTLDFISHLCVFRIIGILLTLSCRLCVFFVTKAAFGFYNISFSD